MNCIEEGTGTELASKTHTHIRDDVNLHGVRSRHLFGVAMMRSDDAEKILNYNGDGCLFRGDPNLGWVKFYPANLEDESHQWLFAKNKDRKKIEQRIRNKKLQERLQKKKFIELTNIKKVYDSRVKQLEENYAKKTQGLQRENEDLKDLTRDQRDGITKLEEENKRLQQILAKQQHEIQTQAYSNKDAKIQQLEGALQEKDRNLREKDEKIKMLAAKLEACGKRDAGAIKV